MAGSTGERIGPFPAGADPVEYDKLRRRVLWKLVYGLYVLGSHAAEHPQQYQLMTITWVTQVSFEPKLLAVSVEREALTHELVHAGGSFSLCLLDREDRAVVRKFVKPVEVDLAGHTLNGFAFRTERTGAPILEQAMAWLDCELRQEVPVGGHTLFIGEVVDCGFAPGASDAAGPDGGAGEDRLVLRMEDTRMNYGG